MPSREKDKRLETLLSARTSLVSGESNFEGRPYFVVKSGPSRPRRVIRQKSILHQSRGGGEETIEQLWEVREGGDLGLPTAADQDVYVALLVTVERRGGMPESGEVAFSLYELIEILGWAHSGASYERVRRCLDRMASTVIRSQRAFYSARTGSYVSDTFTLFNLRLSEAWTRSGKRAERHEIKFHPLLVESVREAHLTRLDPDVYWALTSAVTKRLYRLVVRYCDCHAWSVDPFELRDLVPLAPYAYVSQIRRAIDKAQEELVQIGCLADVTVERNGPRSPGTIRYEISRNFALRRLEQIVGQDPAASEVVTRLVAEGVRRDKAIEMVCEHGPRHCGKYLDLLPYQRGLRRDRSGALIWATEHPDKSGWWEDVANAKRIDGRTSSGTPEANKRAKDTSARWREGYEWLFDRGRS